MSIENRTNTSSVPPSRLPLRVHWQAGLKFKVAGKKYYLAPTDSLALYHMSVLLVRGTHKSLSARLISQIPMIRDIIRVQPRAALAYVAMNTPDPRVRYMAVWLRGLCGGYVGANELRDLALRSQDPRLHKRVAKALRKMGASAQLRRLAESLKLAQQQPGLFLLPTARDHSSRLQRFISHHAAAPSSQALSDAEGSSGRSECPLWVAEGTIIGEGRPAKPLWLIRLVLDRVRTLVSGKSSTDRLPQEFVE